jgi:hypothetical protein
MATQPKKPATGKAPAGGKAVAKFAEAEKPDEADAIAKFALRPSANAAVVIHEYGKPFGDLDLGALVDNLADGAKAVKEGDLSKVEAMLFAQAHTLQSMFMNFSRRALTQTYQKNLEGFFRMALKAQSQCRATLETLAAVKNPPVVFARQANINNGGQQQVNNGGAPADAVNSAQARTGAHAGKPNSDQPELLEESGDGQRLDIGTAGAAGRPDPHMAPVGEVHWPTHRPGQGHGGAKR